MQNPRTTQIVQHQAGILSEYGASTSVLLGGIGKLLLTVFVSLWRSHYYMHCNYTSWDLSYWNTGLCKCSVILQYPSSIDKLQVIHSFWSYILILRPPSEDELLERGDCGGGVVLGGPDVRAVEEPKPDLDRLLPAGHLLPARSPPAGRPTSSSQDPRSPGSEAHSSKEAAKKSTETREGEILTTNSCFRVG